MRCVCAVARRPVLHCPFYGRSWGVTRSVVFISAEGGVVRIPATVPLPSGPRLSLVRWSLQQRSEDVPTKPGAPPCALEAPVGDWVDWRQEQQYVGHFRWGRALSQALGTRAPY